MALILMAYAHQVQYHRDLAGMMTGVHVSTRLSLIQQKYCRRDIECWSLIVTEMAGGAGRTAVPDKIFSGETLPDRAVWIMTGIRLDYQINTTSHSTKLFPRHWLWPKWPGAGRWAVPDWKIFNYSWWRVPSIRKTLDAMWYTAARILSLPLWSGEECCGPGYPFLFGP